MPPPLFRTEEAQAWLLSSEVNDAPEAEWGRWISEWREQRARVTDRDKLAATAPLLVLAEWRRALSPFDTPEVDMTALESRARTCLAWAAVCLRTLRHDAAAIWSAQLHHPRRTLFDPWWRVCAATLRGAAVSALLSDHLVGSALACQGAEARAEEWMRHERMQLQLEVLDAWLDVWLRAKDDAVPDGIRWVQMAMHLAHPWLEHMVPPSMHQAGVSTLQWVLVRARILLSYAPLEHPLHTQHMLRTWLVPHVLSEAALQKWYLWDMAVLWTWMDALTRHVAGEAVEEEALTPHARFRILLQLGEASDAWASLLQLYVMVMLPARMECLHEAIDPMRRFTHRGIMSNMYQAAERAALYAQWVPLWNPVTRNLQPFAWSELEELHPEWAHDVHRATWAVMLRDVLDACATASAGSGSRSCHTMYRDMDHQFGVVGVGDTETTDAVRQAMVRWMEHGIVEPVESVRGLIQTAGTVGYVAWLAPLSFAAARRKWQKKSGMEHIGEDRWREHVEEVGRGWMEAQFLEHGVVAEAVALPGDEVSLGPSDGNVEVERGRAMSSVRRARSSRTPSPGAWRPSLQRPEPATAKPAAAAQRRPRSLSPSAYTALAGRGIMADTGTRLASASTAVRCGDLSAAMAHLQETVRQLSQELDSVPTRAEIDSLVHDDLPERVEAMRHMRQDLQLPQHDFAREYYRMMQARLNTMFEGCRVKMSGHVKANHAASNGAAAGLTAMVDLVPDIAMARSVLQAAMVPVRAGVYLSSRRSAVQISNLATSTTEFERIAEEVALRVASDPRNQSRLANALLEEEQSRPALQRLRDAWRSLRRGGESDTLMRELAIADADELLQSICSQELDAASTEILLRSNQPRLVAPLLARLCLERVVLRAEREEEREMRGKLLRAAGKGALASFRSGGQVAALARGVSTRTLFRTAAQVGQIVT